jgi:Flp pilus assembly protein CpaB
MRITAGTMFVGILAIIAGLVGAYALRASLMKEAPAPAKPATVSVPLASVDLPEGRTITMGDISLYEMTKEEMQARKYPISQVMLTPEQIIGRTTRSGVKQGEPFLTNLMYLEGSGPDVSQLLRPGYRAAQITLKDRNAILPAQGNLVDIVFRSNAKDNKKGIDIPETTMTILQGVEVLVVKNPRPATSAASRASVDLRRSNAGPDISPAVVTVAVTGDQAAILKTVENRGELTLVVRSAKEAVTAVETRGDQKVTLENVLGLEARPDYTFTTEIYRAGDRQTLRFQRGQVVDEVFTGPPARRALPGAVNPTSNQPSLSNVAPAAGSVTGTTR